jgi:hypothetical protein
MRVKKAQKFFAAAIFFFILLGFGAVRLWAEEMPLPEDATLYADRSFTAGPSNINMKIYDTQLSEEKLANFYKKELLKAGWSLKRDLFFTKEKSYVAIHLLPKSKKQAGARFSLTQGVAPTKEEVMATRKDSPDNIKFWPTYPGASQMYLWDTPNGITGAYKTTDSIQNVLIFYKAKMINYGWALYDEVPIKETTPDMSSPLMQEKMQGLSPQDISATLQVKTQTARLAFNRNKELCIISLFATQSKPMEKKLIDTGGQVANMPFGVEPLPLPAESETNISVVYNAGKSIR